MHIYTQTNIVGLFRAGFISGHFYIALYAMSVNIHIGIASKKKRKVRIVEPKIQRLKVQLFMSIL